MSVELLYIGIGYILPTISDGRECADATKPGSGSARKPF